MPTMCSSRLSERDTNSVTPAADAVARVRQRYLDLANSPDLSERRLAKEQLERLERGANSAKEGAPSDFEKRR